MGRWKSWVAVAAAVVVCVAATARADDYESGLDGNTIHPVKSKNIRMASERVEVFVEWPDHRHDHAIMHVVAEFVLVNDGKKAETILISFPGTYNVKEFARFVDDRRVEVTKYVAKHNREELVYTSKVHFEPGQVRRVRVKYQGASDATSGGYFEGEWKYILKTGALWKGKISKAQVVVHFPMHMPPGGFGPFTMDAVSLSPKGYTVSGRTATWVFKDFEPTKDITVGCKSWMRGRNVRASRAAFKGASREERPGLELALAREMLWSDPEAALTLFDELRRTYPDSFAARRIDYTIARAHARYSLHDGTFCVLTAWHRERSRPRPGAAARHYEAAVGKLSNAELRADALCQLFLLYARQLKDRPGAARALGRLREAQLPIGEEYDVPRILRWDAIFTQVRASVGVVSPQAALGLLGSKHRLAASESVGRDASLGLLYAEGLAGPSDHARANRLLKAAADKGDADAMAWYGRSFEFGRKVAKDSKKAFGLYRRAATNGSIGGMEAMGRCYEKGIGVARDLRLAELWYLRSEIVDSRNLGWCWSNVRNNSFRVRAAWEAQHPPPEMTAEDIGWSSPVPPPRQVRAHAVARRSADLIDAYGKAGDLETARLIFFGDLLPLARRERGDKQVARHASRTAKDLAGLCAKAGDRKSATRITAAIDGRLAHDTDDSDGRP